MIWCLLLAVPVFGLSSTIVKLLGSAHVHKQLVASADPMAGWVDFRRGPQLSTTTTVLAHGHSHAIFERHHHDAGDQSVVALDGGTEDAPNDTGSSSAGSGLLVLAALNELRVAPALSADFRWATAPAAPLSSHVSERLERPPDVS